jgi:hypothetical protein
MGVLRLMETGGVLDNNEQSAAVVTPDFRKGASTRVTSAECIASTMRWTF